MRDPKYLAWLRDLYCIVCIRQDHVVECNLIDPAHTENNGMGSKGRDSSCAPLCRKHHQEYDAGRAVFGEKYGVDMPKIAAEHYARYLNEVG
jgi:hypothetical protein